MLFAYSFNNTEEASNDPWVTASACVGPKREEFVVVEASKGMEFSQKKKVFFN